MAVVPCKYGHFSERGAQNKCLQCSLERATKRRAENHEHVRQLERANYAVNREKRIEDSKRYHANNPRKSMLRSAKKRADKFGCPFAISIEHIEIPEFCPLLGIRLQVAKNGVKPYSPSLDRIRPELGYIPGNVWVVSHRANQIKSDATIQELELLIDNLKKKCTYIVRQELIIPWAVTPPATKLESMPWQ